MKYVKRIVITGGHHNSALVLAKALSQKGYEIIWYGHRHASLTDRSLSSEYKEVTAAGFKFINLKAGKIHRGSISQWLKTTKSFLFCLFSFVKQRPDMVVSFGGYLAVPAVIAASFLGIKTVSHEQTTVLGLANRAMLPFLKRLYVTWEIPRLKTLKKVKVVGLPMDENENQGVELPFFQENTHLPLLVVCGGKQGSHFINCLIEDCLAELLPHWRIFHQTGSNLKTRDNLRLSKRKQNLPDDLRSRYEPVTYINNFRSVMKKADIIIGRSGAHTVWEVLSMGKKMIAIPLPFSYGHEQEKNAQKLSEAGIGVILPQKEAHKETLLAALEELRNQSVDSIRLTQKQNEMKKNATDEMVEDIQKLLK